MLLAYSGMLCALSVISLYLSYVFGFNTIALLTISSFFIGVIHIEGKLKYSILSYITVSVIGFLILPNKITALSYIGLFGYYPILKYYIEKRNHLSLEWIIKVIFFTVILFLGYFLFLKATISNWTICLLGVAGLCVYDYALNLLFHFYERRLRKYLKKRE